MLERIKMLFVVIAMFAAMAAVSLFMGELSAFFLEG
jgi:hypothetical protein